MGTNIRQNVVLKFEHVRFEVKDNTRRNSGHAYVTVSDLGKAVSWTCCKSSTKCKGRVAELIRLRGQAYRRDCRRWITRVNILNFEIFICDRDNRPIDRGSRPILKLDF